MSAVQRAPNEIWFSIIDIVLEDLLRLIHNDHPYDTGSDLRTALEDWSSERAKEAESRRRLLILVSSSWKNYVDQYHGWLVSLYDLLDAENEPAEWETIAKKAKRI